jgi:hypothetical protein
MGTRTKIICELAEVILDVTFWFGQTKFKGDKYSNGRLTVTYNHRLRRIGLSPYAWDTSASRVQHILYPRDEIVDFT